MLLLLSFSFNFDFLQTTHKETGSMKKLSNTNVIVTSNNLE